MNKQDNRHSELWNRFVFTIFGLLLLTGALAYLVVLTMMNTDLFRHMEFNYAFSFVVAMLFSIVIGSVITLLVGKQILNPLLKINHASREIAGGNFHIKLEPDTPIREIREIYDNFNQMAAELDGIELMRNDFIAQFSHEFKTPIAAIEGYAALLEDDTLSKEEQAQNIRMIRESARQLSSLSANILKLAKLEKQEIVTEKIRYRLDEQLRQALLYFESEWTRKNLSLTLDLPPVSFRQNRELVMQIWLNLLSNAIKFTPDNGTIQVTLAADETKITVTVKDSGIGMTEQVKRHIFDKFYQGDPSHSGEGNGLGLALVLRIVQMCGAQITADSAPGEGSAFTVVFPGEERQG